MKVGVLFSGGKDSALATLYAMKEGYEVSCLISIDSANKESFMFHTPSISKVRKQAGVMAKGKWKMVRGRWKCFPQKIGELSAPAISRGRCRLGDVKKRTRINTDYTDCTDKDAGIPLVVVKTKGEKEKELADLKGAISRAVNEYGIEGVVTGAVESVYQATRVQKICNDLGIECFNPLWQKSQVEILKELVKEKFEVIVVGVFAYPLDEKWLGRRIDDKFILDISKLEKKYKINVAGEGGEFESFVLDAPFFEKGLEVVGFEDFGEGNSWRREVEVE